MKDESIKILFNNLMGKRLDKLEKNNECIVTSLEGFNKNINILKSILFLLSKFK
jgi:hypothetical protein